MAGVCGLLVSSSSRNALFSRQTRVLTKPHDDASCTALASSLPQLPDVVIDEILHLIEVPDLLRVSSTCKLLNQLGSSDRHWECMLHRDLPGLRSIVGVNPPAWWVDKSWKQRYLALCRGAEFVAQVYNRELANDEEDFVLSAYDATLTLDPSSLAPGCEPSFTASYLPMGGMEAVLEKGISLQRVRPTPPNTRHDQVYRCDLQGLTPGDEVEVQWKGRKAHPFGWWFGVVSEVSLGSGMLSLLFRQYPDSSVWRTVHVPLAHPGKEALVNGDCTFGYIGGVRPLSEREKAEWRQQQLGAIHYCWQQQLLLIPTDGQEAAASLEAVSGNN